MRRGDILWLVDLSRSIMDASFWYDRIFLSNRELVEDPIYMHISNLILFIDGRSIQAASTNGS